MLPSDDAPVDVSKIVSFADRMKADVGVSSRMRRFAEERFDWKAQMDKVLTVLESAVESRKSDVS